MVPYQWDNQPLQIKTKKTASSTVISIKGNVDPESSLLPTYNGISVGLTIRIPQNVVEIENHYTSKPEEMKLTNMPSISDGKEMRWILYKLKRKLLIICRANIVWEMDYVKLFDQKHDSEVFSQRSMKAWSKTVTEIIFTSEDDATLGYRKTGMM